MTTVEARPAAAPAPEPDRSDVLDDAPVVEEAPTPPKGLPYLPGLDGLRALAVMAVLVYHLELGSDRMLGGYLGVEVFFVVSGYLITGLLLQEHSATGTIGLRSFWTRRARRLLPAVVAVIAVTVTVTAIFARSDLALLRGDAVASLFYVQNWHAVFAEQPYFAAFGRPSPLRHLWSLSIEEQFYVFWPLLLMFGLKRFSRRTLLVLTLGGVAASVLLMGALTSVTDLERGYYGTDTRAFGVLIGAALAMVWKPGRRFVDHRGKNAPWAIDVVAGLALLALLWQLDHRSEYDPWTFPQGLLWVDVLTVALIVACATVGSKVSAVLSIPLLVAVGRRSYSLYLWHWPVFVYTRPGTDIPLTGWPANLLRLALAFALAELSYRFVEQPFRDGRAQARWHTLRQAEPKVQRAALAGAVGCALVLVVATVTARTATTTDAGSVPVVALPPPTTASTLPPTTTSTTVPESTTPGETTESTTTAPTTTVAPTTDPAVVTERVSAFGDSVMLGAAPGLQRRFAAAQIDAVVGRQAAEVVDDVAALADSGELADTVVVQMGNNGPITTDDLDRLNDVKGDRRLILVNVSLPRRWAEQVNDTMGDWVGDHDGVVLVDWAAAAEGRDELKVGDGTHLSSAGIALYSDMIAAAVRG